MVIVSSLSEGRQEKVVWGAGRQKVRNIWTNLAVYNLNLWDYIKVLRGSVVCCDTTIEMLRDSRLPSATFAKLTIAVCARLRISR